MTRSSQHLLSKDTLLWNKVSSPRHRRQTQTTQTMFQTSETMPQTPETIPDARDNPKQYFLQYWQVAHRKLPLSFTVPSICFWISLNCAFKFIKLSSKLFPNILFNCLYIHIIIGPQDSTQGIECSLVACVIIPRNLNRYMPHFVVLLWKWNGFNLHHPDQVLSAENTKHKARKLVRLNCGFISILTIVYNIRVRCHISSSC